jgi:CIC family chloride channel protein
VSEPSGPWFSHQPNVTGRGIVASYTPRFWLIVIALGLITGVAGSALMEILRLVEHASWDYHAGTFLAAVKATPAWRHLTILASAAIVVGAGVLLLGRLPSSGGGEISESLWLHEGRMGLLASVARGALSIVTVGMGVSLGREAAPQLAGAATASRFADWSGLPLWQRRLLVASGAGAGMAAVYNVPLGGALFALEVLLGTLAVSLVLPALVTSLIATAVAWTTLSTNPTYSVPSYGVHASQLIWAALMGPIAGVGAVIWVRVIARANALRPRHAGRFVAPLVVFCALGAVAIPYPQLLGNGLDIVQLASVGGISLGLLAILLALKPLATAACLGSGAPGGLFTPTLTVGILIAGITGTAWAHLWPGAPAGSYALIGGGAFLAAAMQGPLSGVVLVLELTRHTDALMVPTLLVVAEATVIARRFGAPSIYSARLGAKGERAAARHISVDVIEDLDARGGLAPYGSNADAESRPARSLPADEAWAAASRGELAILDLRTRAERRRYGWPPLAPRVSLLRHALWPDGPRTVYLCQHAVRSRLTLWRGAAQIEGGWVAWQRVGLPGSRRDQRPDCVRAPGDLGD